MAALSDLDQHVKDVHKSEEQPRGDDKKAKQGKRPAWVIQRLMWLALCRARVSSGGRGGRLG